jgi:hypothetical protein
MSKTLIENAPAAARTPATKAASRWPPRYKPTMAKKFAYIYSIYIIHL